MAISANYPTPVVVNGFLCRNCTDVANAKKHIDPAHPQSGPFNIDAKTDPTRALQQAVSFGGSLSELDGSTSSSAAAPPPAAGNQVDITA